MAGTMQEADIRTGFQAGRRTESVLIVSRRDEAGGVEHVPYLLPSRRRGFVLSDYSAEPVCVPTEISPVLCASSVTI